MAISVGKAELPTRGEVAAGDAVARQAHAPAAAALRLRARRGTLLLLPIDQGIEHGPRDFFPNPASKDPEYQFRLAAEAGYSAIACGYGMASKYYPDYAGQVPLLLKLNSKTDIPPADEALSPCNASVEDAVRLGADAVGYTLYVGSPRRRRTSSSSARCARTATASACRS